MARSISVLPSEVLPRDDRREETGFLRANSDAYERIAAQLPRMDWERNPEAVLARVQLAARSAATFHAGRFADGRIENVAFQIGAQLDRGNARRLPYRLPTTGKRRMLHVVSAVLGIGGHSRMLYHWLCNDGQSCHSIVLLGQGKFVIPNWLLAAVQRRGGTLISLPPSLSLHEKARALRSLALQGADLVVLHHGGWDVVPTVAFAESAGPPVAVLNHADHEFWLGSSVADLVINLRTAAVAHTRERRFVDHNTVLPIPLVQSHQQHTKEQARRKLGITDGEVVLLSVARAEKFRPHGRYSFLATATRILERNPRTRLFIVGETRAGLNEHAQQPLPDHLHAVGVVEDPSIYRAAADIFLETFPFGSQTSVLEAAQAGIPVVPAYAPLFPLLVANDDSIVDLMVNPRCEEEYIARVESLVSDSSEREDLSSLLSRRMQADHAGDGWVERLQHVYQETDALTHVAGQIPISSCSESGADIGLSHWRVMADGRTTAPIDRGDSNSAVLYHEAYLARETRNYVGAIRYAFRALWRKPFKWTSWRLMAVNCLGPSAVRLRQIQLQVQTRCTKAQSPV